MTTPRIPFGPSPGRMPAIMLKVLAAEMADALRLQRGKRYHADGAVTDIEIEPGLVVAAVQGSRVKPYEVSLAVAPGDGMPARRDLRIVCSCPDDDGTGRHACKHAVAALFTLADEVSIEPDLLERWRSGDARYFPAADHEAPSDAVPLRSRRSTAPNPARLVAPDPAIAAIDALLQVPGGMVLDALPPPTPIEHPRLPAGLAAGVLADALRHLHHDAT